MSQMCRHLPSKYSGDRQLISTWVRCLRYASLAFAIISGSAFRHPHYLNMLISYGGERIPQLMCEHGEKFVFPLIGLGQLQKIFPNFVLPRSSPQGGSNCGNQREYSHRAFE